MEDAAAADCDACLPVPQRKLELPLHRPRMAPQICGSAPVTSECEDRLTRSDRRTATEKRGAAERQSQNCRVTEERLPALVLDGDLHLACIVTLAHVPYKRAEQKLRRETAAAAVT
eukprot:4319113-Prymnesium_polylepis.2